MTWSKPSADAVRAALSTCAPRLAEAQIGYLGDGWSVWAFTVAGYVIRFPKNADAALQLQRERALLPALARAVSLQVPNVSIYGSAGPNDAPFSGHRMVEGTPLMEAGMQPDTAFARDLGRFLRELHAAPVEAAIEAGGPLRDGATLRRERQEHYEDVVRRCFPLISCEARTYVEQVYEPYLNDGANFEFEPCLVHGDLDSNTLIDPQSGKLAGVIDFGDVSISNPAQDFWMPVFCFPRLGIASQLDECFEAAGITPAQRRRMQGEIDFILARFPLVDMLHGLDTGEDDFVEGGIRDLNASLPKGLTCD